MVHVDISDGGTRLTIGTHVGQLVVLAEGLATGRRADASGDIHLFRHNVLPDSVHCRSIALTAIASGRSTPQCCHVGHAGIHIGGSHGMSHGLVLLHHWLMGLRVVVGDGGLAAIVQEEAGLIQIYLMTRHHAGLSLSRSHLAAHHIGIAHGNVEELAAARSLIVRNGSFHHVAQVVQLVAQVFLLHPPRIACPVMGIAGVLCAGGVKIAVGLLSRGNDVNHRVYVMAQLLVGEGLQQIRCTLNGLIDIGVVEREAHAVHLEHFRGVLQMFSGMLKVLISPLALAFREGQRDSDAPRGIESLSPERGRHYLHGGEGYWLDRIVLRSNSAEWQTTNKAQQNLSHTFFSIFRFSQVLSNGEKSWDILNITLEFFSTILSQSHSRRFSILASFPTPEKVFF